jgi:peptidoglycan/xylan/chitin deacetylase (PgdA/CDA1 family)
MQGAAMRFVYPQGKRKALTFSYDDAQVFDRRLVAIFNQYGLKATFHLNSGTLRRDDQQDEAFIYADEVRDLYAGHEISCHGVEHRNLPTVSPQEVLTELTEDRRSLEQLAGYMVQGMSYAFGNYSQKVKEIVSSAGIKYARTVASTKYYFPPTDFLEWHPTCHHNEALDLAEQFINIYDFYELPLMYVWGHSYEFDRQDNWNVIEELAAKLSGHDDIWYATNMEICNYLLATRQQEFSMDGRLMHNPTATSIWLRTSSQILCVAPGETVQL